MKYMGSKRWMLGNGLGELLDVAAPKATRFVDLFAGSAAVAVFVATRHKVNVLAADLQTYSKVLSAAVIERTADIQAEAVWASWKKAAQEKVSAVRSIPDVSKVTKASVEDARDWCAQRRGRVVTRAYGGHYFSPAQAIWIDALRSTLPADEPASMVALAALIEAASYCAAAPGHTAQPFQPTRTAKPFLIDAWARSVANRVEVVFGDLCKRHAMVQGNAVVASAVDLIPQFKKGDLIFIDPPYSGVHYSRFYHVLETIATGTCYEVSGVGRYPDSEFRPKSDFSVKTKSKKALDDLLGGIAEQGASAIVTFPAHDCSNGLSGAIVRETAAKYFSVEEKIVSSKFSTLGGTSGTSAKGSERAARKPAQELILHLRPK